MQELSTTPTEAVLLYREAPRIELDTFVHDLNDALGDLGIGFELTSLAGDDFAVYTHPKMHLHLTLSRVPLPYKALAPALGAPITLLKTHDYETAASMHRRTLTIALGDGPGRVPETPVRQLALDLKLTVLHRALRKAMDRSAPLAVLWAQSGMIFVPEEIEAIDLHHFPAALAIHPVPTRAPGQTTGKPSLGVRGKYSELFCGRQLAIAPGAVPLPEAIGVIEHLVDAHVARSTALCDGVQLPYSDDRHLNVRYQPDRSHCATGVFDISFDAGAQSVPTKAPETIDATTELSGMAPSNPDEDDLSSAFMRDTDRSRSLRTYAICLAVATVMPLAAGALFIWNLVRGPNLVVSAMAGAMVLAFFVAISLIGLTTGNEFAEEMMAVMRKPL